MERCTECQGRRVVSRMQPEIRRSQGLDYHTGREVERLYQCERCGGTGREPEPPVPAAVVCEGVTVDAPGFTSETFATSLDRARSRGTLPMMPARLGGVLVESARSGARYHVTRDRCSCPAGASHGYCYHRAAVIACADLYGIDVCRVRVLGFNPFGKPVVTGVQAGQLQEVA